MGDIYHDIRKLCDDVFCRNETLPMRFSLVSMSRPLPSSARGTAARVVRTQILMSVWENDYLQYS